jgi:hypothetical protein
MSFEIKADGIDAQKLLAEVHARIAERRASGLYTDEELRYLEERPLEGVVTAQELRADLFDEFKARDGQWNYSFDPETIFRSSRGAAGRFLGIARRVLRPVQKLFWNPTPMIAALSRQSDLNRFSVHLLHNLVLELSRLNLELSELRSRNQQLAARLEALERREKTLESMVAYRDDAKEGAERR